jgi:ubiquinol-cytochrome c reductase cytochrome c1 subunit
MLGKFDRQQLQRGFQVYKEVCAACHGLNLRRFRDLADLGYSEPR